MTPLHLLTNKTKSKGNPPILPKTKIWRRSNNKQKMGAKTTKWRTKMVKKNRERRKEGRNKRKRKKRGR